MRTKQRETGNETQAVSGKSYADIPTLEAKVFAIQMTNFNTE